MKEPTGDYAAKEAARTCTPEINPDTLRIAFSPPVREYFSELEEQVKDDKRCNKVVLRKVHTLAAGKPQTLKSLLIAIHEITEVVAEMALFTRGACGDVSFHNAMLSIHSREEKPFVVTRTPGQIAGSDVHAIVHMKEPAGNHAAKQAARKSMSAIDPNTLRIAFSPPIRKYFSESEKEMKGDNHFQKMARQKVHALAAGEPQTLKSLLVAIQEITEEVVEQALGSLGTGGDVSFHKAIRSIRSREEKPFIVTGAQGPSRG